MTDLGPLIICNSCQFGLHVKIPTAGVVTVFDTPKTETLTLLLAVEALFPTGRLLLASIREDDPTHNAIC